MVASALVSSLTAYLNQVYDGKSHEWGEDQETFVDAIFHDDMNFHTFEHHSLLPKSTLGIKIRNKADEEKLVSMGTPYSGLDSKEFSLIDNRHLGSKASFQHQTDFDYLVEYTKNGMIVLIEPYNHATAINPKTVSTWPHV